MKKIIYLHGFASNSNSKKGCFLKEFFGERVICPNLTSKPIEDIPLIKGLLRKYQSAVIVGSSLGGFYAEYFSNLNSLDTLLINPLTDVALMEPFIGQHNYFDSNDSFQFTLEDYIYMKDISRFKDIGSGNKIIILAKNDDKIPYIGSIKHYNNINEKIVLYNYGGHSFNERNEIIGHLNQLINSK